MNNNYQYFSYHSEIGNLLYCLCLLEREWPLTRPDWLIIGILPHRIFLSPIPKQRFFKFSYPYKKSKFLYTDTKIESKTLVEARIFLTFHESRKNTSPHWEKRVSIVLSKNVEKSVGHLAHARRVEYPTNRPLCPPENLFLYSHSEWSEASNS